MPLSNTGKCHILLYHPNGLKVQAKLLYFMESASQLSQALGGFTCSHWISCAASSRDFKQSEFVGLVLDTVTLAHGGVGNRSRGWEKEQECTSS